VVVHEAAHAALAARLGSRERYLSVPAWFREGLALAASGEGEDRVAAREIAEVVEPRGRGAPAASGRAVSRLAHDAVGFERVRALRAALGADAWRAVLAALERGEDLRKLLTERYSGVLAERIPRIEAQHRPVRERMRADLAQLREGLGLLSSGDLAAAEACFERVLRDNGGPRVVGETARLFAARTAARAGDPARALELLSGLWEEPVEGLWEAESLALGAESARLTGRPELAQALARECLERFAEDRDSAAAARAVLSSVPDAQDRAPDGR
jgi:hypothetical protein